MDWVKIVVIILAIAKVIDWIAAFKRHKRNREFKNHKYIKKKQIKNLDMLNKVRYTKSLTSPR